MVRDDAQRALLFDLDMAIVRLTQQRAERSVAGHADRRLSQPAAHVGRTMNAVPREARPALRATCERLHGEWMAQLVAAGVAPRTGRDGQLH